MSNTHPYPIRAHKEALRFQLVRKREDKNYAAIPVGVASLGEPLKWDISESDRGFLGHVSSPEEYLEAFRGQATKKRVEDFLLGQDSVLGVMGPDMMLGAWKEPRLYALSIAELFKSFSHRPYPKSSGQQWREKIKKEVSGLLESGETEEEVAPEAVKYACQIVDRLPAECAFLPSPDVSGFADKKAVYFEWLLETDGRLLLTVEPDGTVAYVCTFGNARSRNLGAWEDGIVDLMRPCFVKLVQLHKKDFHAWDASRTAHLSPDLSSKAKR